MGRLPKSGLSLYTLLEQAVVEIRAGATGGGGSSDGTGGGGGGGESSGGGGGGGGKTDLNPLIDHSPLILILSRIPDDDYEELLMGVSKLWKHRKTPFTHPTNNPMCSSYHTYPYTPHHIDIYMSYLFDMYRLC